MSKIQLKSDFDVELIQHTGDDLMIARAAWVSTGNEEPKLREGQTLEDCVEGVLKFLIKHRHGCYDSKTEVLTSSGWKNWGDVSVDDSFATLNLANMEIEYQRPSRIIHKEVTSERMIRIESASVDLLVTEDHNMVAQPRCYSSAKYQFVKASEFKNRSHRVMMSGGRRGGKSLSRNDALLLGFCIADGSCKSGTPGFHLRKTRKVEFLKSICDVSQSGDRFYVPGLGSEILRLCKETYDSTGNRRVPPEIISEYDSDTAKCVIEGFLNGDGSVSVHGTTSFSTVSENLIDDMQALGSMCGMPCVRRCSDEKRSGAFGSRQLHKACFYSDRRSCPRIGWTIELRENEVSTQEYTGTIHCATVPNGTLYVRRNGKPLWCGNSPFEHGSITLRVNIPVFLWREWHRHRIGFSYNEQSGRYQKLAPVFYVPPDERYEHCVKPPEWKPSKPGFRGLLPAAMKAEATLRSAYKDAYSAYDYYMARGFDNGLARIVLPVGIYSACYVTCNPRSLMSFLSLRVDSEDATIPSHPQWEMHKVALQVEEVFAKIWPITHRLWNDNGRVAP